MISFAPRPLIYLSLLFLAQPCQAADPTSNPSGAVVGFANATKDIYGFGVRIGIYCQIVAFLIGFLNLLRVDVKSQFAGQLLAWSLLIRFFVRTNDKDLSRPEGWIAVALLLSFTVPGIWLLWWVFRAQRKKLQSKGDRAARKEIVQGQGLNILLMVASTISVIIVNVWFSFYLSPVRDKGVAPKYGVADKIWIISARSPDSTWIRIALGAQAVGCTGCVYPIILYTTLWSESIYYWMFPDDDSVSDVPSDWADKVKKHFEHWGLSRKWLLVLMALLFLSYSGALVLSIEMTINAAGLTPEKSVIAPGQLVPLVTGVLSLLSAAFDFLRRRGANEIAPWEFPKDNHGPDDDGVPLTHLRAQGGSGSSTWNQSNSSGTLGDGDLGAYRPVPGQQDNFYYRG